jgi:hypothetical protein
MRGAIPPFVSVAWCRSSAGKTSLSLYMLQQVGRAVLVCEVVGFPPAGLLFHVRFGPELGVVHSFESTRHHVPEPTTFHKI